VFDENDVTADVIFRNLNQEDVRIIAAAQSMYGFIYEWKERMRELVKYSTLEGDAYNAVEKIRDDFHESMSEHRISEIFG